MDPYKDICVSFSYSGVTEFIEMARFSDKLLFNQEDKPVNFEHFGQL